MTLSVLQSYLLSFIILMLPAGKILAGIPADSTGQFVGDYAIFYKDGAQGIIDKAGKEILPAQFKNIELDRHGRARLLKFPKFTILTGSNEPITSFEADDVTVMGNGFYLVQANGISTIYNAEKEAIIQPGKWRSAPFDDHFTLVKNGKQQGVLHDEGSLQLSENFDSLFISENRLIVQHSGAAPYRWMLYDLKGQPVAQRSYQAIYPGPEGLFPFKRHDRWGYLNMHGEEVITPQYDSAEHFRGKYAKAYYLGSQGMIDQKGNWVIQPKYDQLRIAGPDLFYFHLNEKQGLVRTGNEILHSSENALKPLNAGFIYREAGSKMGLINEHGKKILPPSYDYISEMQEDKFYQFMVNGHYGLVDKFGKIHIDTSSHYQHLQRMHDGYMGVKINGKYGFVDTNGDLRIANQYDSIGTFSEDRGQVMLRGKWAYVDHIERLKVQPLYSIAAPFKNGLAIVGKNGKKGIIDKNGTVIMEINYSEIVRLSGGQFLVEQSGKQGLADASAHIVIFPKYDKVNVLGNGFVIVEKDGKKGVLTEKGISTIPLLPKALHYELKTDTFIIKEENNWEPVTLS